MPKSQYYTATSLDGFIADESNSLDWLLQFGDEPGGSYEKFIADVGALAMGSTTYDWVIDNHINGPDGPKDWPYSQPTWVFTSRNLRRIEGADIRFVKGDIKPVYDEMAAVAGERNIWVVGGGELVGKFLDAGLLHEIIVQIAPVTLGGGASLLPRRIATPPLQLKEHREIGGGFIELRYAVPTPESNQGARE